MTLQDIITYTDLRARYNPEISEDEHREMLVELIKVHLTADEIFDLLQSFTKMEKKAKRLTKEYLEIKDALDTCAHEKNLKQIFTQ